MVTISRFDRVLENAVAAIPPVELPAVSFDNPDRLSNFWHNGLQRTR